MLSFLTRVYRKLTDIFCWVWLIGFTVFMAIVFNESMDWLFDDWAVFVGVIAGLVIGFWTELIILPPIMVLFEINDKLDFLVRKEKKVSKKDKKNEEEIITTENEDCVETVVEENDSLDENLGNSENSENSENDGIKIMKAEQKSVDEEISASDEVENSEKVVEELRPVIEKTEDDINFWICKGCGEKNWNTLIYCEHCGKYKQVPSFGFFVFKYFVF